VGHIIISPAALKNPQERKDLGERLQVKTSSQENGRGSYGTQPTSTNRISTMDCPENKEIVVTLGTTAIL
jgi:hypothetical protein